MRTEADRTRAARYWQKLKADPVRLQAKYDAAKPRKQAYDKARQADPEFAAKKRKQARANYYKRKAKDPDAHLRQQVERRSRRRYGLSTEQRSELLITQQGLCGVCERPISFNGKRGVRNDSAVVDHCHKTGKVRAVLCGGCNVALGGFRDDPSVLRKAADYLEKHRG